MSNYKLFQVNSLEYLEGFTFLVDSQRTKEDVVRMIKERGMHYDDFDQVVYGKVDLRTLKEVPIPMGDKIYHFKDEWNNHVLLYKGTDHVRWDTEANINYPEDLTWERDISSLVHQVINLCNAVSDTVHGGPVINMEKQYAKIP